MLDSWLVLTAAASATSLAALELARTTLSRRREALRVNRGLVPANLPSLEGPLRDATCGALLGAALGDAAGSQMRRVPAWLAARLESPRRRAWRPLWRPGRYAVRTQLMLAAARAVEPDGTLNMRRYRLELAYLARYATDAPYALESAAQRLRRGRLERDVASQRRIGDEILLVAVPLGVALHDRPTRAAALAAELAAQTHARVEVRQSAAIVAAAVAHCVQRHGRDEPMSLAARRLWIERVGRDAGGPDGPAAIAVLPVADLASQPFARVRERMRVSRSALDVLTLSLQISLHRLHEPAAALRDALSLGRFAPGVASLALAMIGARCGAAALEQALDDELERLQDRREIELQGEKLALVQPQAVAPGRLRRRLTSGR